MSVAPYDRADGFSPGSGAIVHVPGLDTAAAFSRTGAAGLPSAIEIWDSGPGRVQPPPLGDVPPLAGPANTDPHSDPRSTPAAQQQISDFLQADGAVTDVCASQPCHSSVYSP